MIAEFAKSNFLDEKLSLCFTSPKHSYVSYKFDAINKKKLLYMYGVNSR